MKYLILVATSLLCANAAFLPNMDPPKLDGKIIGGYPINIEDAPYTVSLQRDRRLQGKYRHVCGATILNATVIVTAAHCTNNSKAEQWTVRAGSKLINDGGQVIQVLRYVQHPNFTTMLVNDISLVILKTPIILGPSASPIELPEQGEVVREGALSVTNGWGVLKDNGPSPKNLYQVTLPIIGQKKCQKQYSGFNYVSKEMICAGRLGIGGQDACAGDSGGPLVVNHVLVGITSWGRGCALPKFPGVWTNVASFIDWIKASLK